MLHCLGLSQLKWPFAVDRTAKLKSNKQVPTTARWEWARFSLELDTETVHTSACMWVYWAFYCTLEQESVTCGYCLTKRSLTFFLYQPTTRTKWYRRGEISHWVETSNRSRNPALSCREQLSAQSPGGRDRVRGHATQSRIMTSSATRHRLVSSQKPCHNQMKMSAYCHNHFITSATPSPSQQHETGAAPRTAAIARPSCPARTRRGNGGLR